MHAYLTPEQAGKVLGLSPQTLARYRQNGSGPAYYKFGHHVRYRTADITAWAAERRVRQTPGRSPDKATGRRKFPRSLTPRPLLEEPLEPMPGPR